MISCPAPVEMTMPSFAAAVRKAYSPVERIISPNASWLSRKVSISSERNRTVPRLNRTTNTAKTATVQTAKVFRRLILKASSMAKAPVYAYVINGSPAVT